MNRKNHLWDIQCKNQKLIFVILILSLTLPGLLNKLGNGIIKKVLKLFKFELFIIQAIFASDNRVEFSCRWERAQEDSRLVLIAFSAIVPSAMCALVCFRRRGRRQIICLQASVGQVEVAGMLVQKEYGGSYVWIAAVESCAECGQCELDTWGSLMHFLVMTTVPGIASPSSSTRSSSIWHHLRPVTRKSTPNIDLPSEFDFSVFLLSAPTCHRWF